MGTDQFMLAFKRFYEFERIHIHLLLAIDKGGGRGTLIGNRTD